MNAIAPGLNSAPLYRITTNDEAHKSTVTAAASTTSRSGEGDFTRSVFASATAAGKRISDRTVTDAANLADRELPSGQCRMQLSHRPVRAVYATRKTDILPRIV